MRMNFGRLPLIITDRFEFYQKVIRRFFGPACLYVQVLKTRRNGRIIKVERRALHGARSSSTAWRFEDALRAITKKRGQGRRSGNDHESLIEFLVLGISGALVIRIDSNSTRTSVDSSARSSRRRRSYHRRTQSDGDALNNSEDSSTLNTSFIERLNLTIRQSSAYLSRRTLSHARSTERLDEHLELLRCYYNFVRPHGALKFGRSELRLCRLV